MHSAYLKILYIHLIFRPFLDVNIAHVNIAMMMKMGFIIQPYSVAVISYVIWSLFCFLNWAINNSCKSRSRCGSSNICSFNHHHWSDDRYPPQSDQLSPCLFGLILPLCPSPLLSLSSLPSASLSVAIICPFPLHIHRIQYVSCVAYFDSANWIWNKGALRHLDLCSVCGRDQVLLRLKDLRGIGLCVCVCLSSSVRDVTEPQEARYIEILHTAWIQIFLHHGNDKQIINKAASTGSSHTWCQSGLYISSCSCQAVCQRLPHHSTAGGKSIFIMYYLQVVLSLWLDIVMWVSTAWGTYSTCEVWAGLEHELPVW